MRWFYRIAPISPMQSDWIDCQSKQPAEPGFLDQAGGAQFWRGIARRPTFAECKRTRRVKNEEVAAGIAAKVEILIVCDRCVWREADRRTAVSGRVSLPRRRRRNFFSGSVGVLRRQSRAIEAIGSRA